MLQITLSRRETLWANDVAEKRLRGKGRDPRFAYVERSGIETHRLGAQAELAFCLALGLHWPARSNTFRDLPDVDPFWEVRWSSNPERVKVAVDDPAHFLVAHVYGSPPTFTVAGWVCVDYVQQRYPAVDLGGRGRKAHFAPASVLVPLNGESHTACHYARSPGGTTWRCMFCGRPP